MESLTPPPHLTKLTTSLVAKTMRSVVFAVEVIIRSSVIPAATVITAVAPGTVLEKVESGLMAPKKVYEFIRSIPKDVENAEKLVHALEGEWTIAKIRTLVNLGTAELQKIAKKEIGRIQDMMGGSEIFRKCR